MTGSVMVTFASMVITLHTQNIIADISAEFLAETGSVDTMPAKGKLIQTLNESVARLKVILNRYMDYSDVNQTAEDSLGIEDQLVFNLWLSTRKGTNKAQSLADAMHAFLVNATLAKSYSVMVLPELAKKHDEQSVADATLLNTLLNSKLPPVY